MSPDPVNALALTVTEQLSQPSIASALPSDFNQQRFVQNAIAAVNGNETLAKFTTAQLAPAIMRGAMLGLDFFNKEAYLVPYGQQVQFQPSYTGLVKLAKKYGGVADVKAEIVREGDEFTMSMQGGAQSFTFDPKPFNDGPIIGAFAVATMNDGSIKVERMTKRQLDNVKMMSRSQSGNAWKLFPEEMYKKVVVRRLCKGITIDFENTEQAKVFRSEDDERETPLVENPFEVVADAIE